MFRSPFPRPTPPADSPSHSPSRLPVPLPTPRPPRFSVLLPLPTPRSTPPQILRPTPPPDSPFHSPPDSPSYSPSRFPVPLPSRFPASLPFLPLHPHHSTRYCYGPDLSIMFPVHTGIVEHVTRLDKHLESGHCVTRSRALMTTARALCNRIDVKRHSVLCVTFSASQVRHRFRHLGAESAILTDRLPLEPRELTESGRQMATPPNSKLIRTLQWWPERNRIWPPARSR